MKLVRATDVDAHARTVTNVANALGPLDPCRTPFSAVLAVPCPFAKETEVRMANNVMARIESLVLALREISKKIEPELHVVSPVTRDEWRALQGSWPSDSQLREGTPGFTEEQLEAIIAKTRRFKDIVHGLALSLPGQRFRDDDSSISER